MNSEKPGMRDEDSNPPAGFLVFLFSAILIPVGFATLIMGRNSQSRAMSLIGAVVTASFAFLTLFGLLRWQWGMVKGMSSQKEKLVYLGLAICGLVLGVILDWLL
jgi:amino acid permease